MNHRLAADWSSMGSLSPSSVVMLDALERLRVGDARARDDLIEYASSRLKAIAGRMLAEYPTVARWEETDDVLQAALLKLHRALATAAPVDKTHFLRLSTKQIRYTLLELARHYRTKEDFAKVQSAPRPADGSAVLERFVDQYELRSLDEWTLFHDSIEELPEKERQVFELVWYQGLAQTEVAALLHVTERTVRRYWTAARLHLVDLMEAHSGKLLDG